MTLRIICFFILIDGVVVSGLFGFGCKLEFEKVLGLRPSNSNHRLLLHKNEDNNNTPITAECIEKCNSNTQCKSFVIYYNVSSCYWFNSTIQGEQELENVIDLNTAWFVKACLSVKNCKKLWIIETIPGATLVGNDTKVLPNLMTRTDCQQSCLNEKRIRCRSAKFRIQNSDYGPNDETKGTCILSDADRHIRPNAYRASGYDDEYFENQCSESYLKDEKNEFCSYEEFDNATLTHSDILYENQTKDRCQQLCEETEIFNCRGYSLVRNDNFDCYLHSEDSKVHGPKLLKENALGAYFERTQCINITITCSETYMTVKYTPKMNFMGRMYMEGYSEQPECFALGRGTNTVGLKLSVMSTQCGLIKALAAANRTLMSGTMILQYNPLVQTQGDRTIRVGCIYGNQSKVLVGTGITIASAPNKGSPLVNFTNTVSTPMVEMRVLDLNTQGEVSSTQIGQELQLIIEMKPSDGSLDIWASHLVAMTEHSDESILLLDDRGCPTNLNIFPALKKVTTEDSIKLVANFQAFKFSSSPIVRFSVIVQFCIKICPAVDCGIDGLSYGRRKREIQTLREIQTRSLETINGTKIIKVNRTDFENAKGQRMPLEFIMIVRNPVANSDKLVLGDGKILVAGYDYTTNEVCLDYSLFIGLIITWVLIQVIFIVCCLVLVRRYKKYYETENTTQSLEELNKNFGIGFSNLENRRVHWADNGDYT